MSHTYDVVIVGGGPAGIASAIEAKALGLTKVLMIEKGENHSQTIRKFYKDSKRVDKDYKGIVVELKGSVDFEDGTKESTLDYFDALLDNENIDTLFNLEVEKITKEKDVFRVTTSNVDYVAKNVIIAIGTMGKPNKPDYKTPSSLRDKVNFNINKSSEGEDVLVVGGGNSAIEYAIDLAQTNNVTLAYRKEKFTRVNDTNKKMLYEYSAEYGLEIKMNTDITSLEDENERPKVHFNDESYTVYDRVIYAIGGTAPVDFLKSSGVTFDENEKAILDKNFESETKGLYLAGDIAVRKGGSIAFALSHAYHIIAHITK
ncbi:MAG: NAD(P)-binding domain-containing protein [Sulfurovum sp.]|nr:NAD(P)-binding domain-containing protein [Sulfurovum sp.]